MPSQSLSPSSLEFSAVTVSLQGPVGEVLARFAHLIRPEPSSRVPVEEIPDTSLEPHECCVRAVISSLSNMSRHMS